LQVASKVASEVEVGLASYNLLPLREYLQVFDQDDRDDRDTRAAVDAFQLWYALFLNPSLMLSRSVSDVSEMRDPFPMLAGKTAARALSVSHFSSRSNVGNN
jgi:hypothetical protein